MRHEQSGIGHEVEIGQSHSKNKENYFKDIVLEKSIFNNVFEKDIRRVFIYKKAERLAKAIHLISPAFVESTSLRNRIDSIAIGLVDAAILPLGVAKITLSRELLALSSILSVARTGGLLSAMNADLITKEAHILLQEVAAYEEPRLFLDDAPTLSDIAKNTSSGNLAQKHDRQTRAQVNRPRENSRQNQINKGHIKDRRDAVMSVIKEKKHARIKDISMLIRGVSEKTIQRELATLIADGIILKKGERRWSTYSLRETALTSS